MTTKYYYNGKLARTSKSSKLSYNYAIYIEKYDKFENFSRDYPPLVREIMKQIERVQANINYYTTHGEVSPGDLEYARHELDWWNSARIVKLDKVVTE